MYLSAYQEKGKGNNTDDVLTNHFLVKSYKSWLKQFSDVLFDSQWFLNPSNTLIGFVSKNCVHKIFQEHYKTPPDT